MAHGVKTSLISRAAALAALWAVAFVCASRGPALADARIGRFTVNFAEGVFQRSGDFVIPGAVNGRSPDGDFKADRAFGNYQRQDVTLVGHVLLHQRVASGRAAQPMTLTANQLRIFGKPATYTATGSVVVVQQNRKINADFLQLNDRTHQGLLRGNVSAQENDRVVQSQEIQYNVASGAIVVPGQLNGFSSDSDFRADRGVGNQKAGTFTMTGNVIVHRFGNATTNNSSEPLTMWCDKLDINQHPQTTYTATGNVKIAQGDRTLTGPVLTLNDVTHTATMKGGVHGEEPPDRTFDAAEVIYNTVTEDFKALGGVRATFPFRRGEFGASPTPVPHASAKPSHSPAPNASPTPAPASSPEAGHTPTPAPTG
ncbi:MAG: LPS export ABC transporter periplasmic protein LptC [Candidatus Eremiobacteraeota bacterium]|nr:LPS export ABC transporter periplasmic protein LptC [Candidatus Eremiobacteraeota bacterium]